MKLRAFTAFEGTEIAGYNFWCPGCDDPHQVMVTGKLQWGFSGTVDSPTFTPSILVYGIAPVPESNWPGLPRCHSFVKNGMIQFLDDCEHKLKGQTVPLPEWPKAQDY
jgi:hypothetical protein